MKKLKTLLAACLMLTAVSLFSCQKHSSDYEATVKTLKKTGDLQTVVKLYEMAFTDKHEDCLTYILKENPLIEDTAFGTLYAVLADKNTEKYENAKILADAFMNAGINLSLDYLQNKEKKNLEELQWVNNSWNKIFTDNNTLLEFASIIQSKKWASYLIKNGGDVNCALSSYLSTIYYDEDEKDFLFLAFLKKNKANFNTDECFSEVFGRGLYYNIELLKQLIKFGFDINHTRESGYNMLMELSRQGKKEHVELLIKAKADVNKKDNDGETALSYALKNDSENQKEIISMLLRAGADISGKDGKELLLKMIEAKDKDSVSLLSKKNVNVNFIDETSKKSPLDYAESLGESGSEIADILKKAGGKNTQALKDIYNAFFEAIEKSEIDTIKKFIKDGIDIECRSGFGRTPLIHAVDTFNIDVVKLLIESGADVNALSDDKESALYRSVCNSIDIELTRLLLKAGAADTGNESALWEVLSGHHIHDNEYTELVKLLLDYGSNPNTKPNYYRSGKFQCENEDGLRILDLLCKYDYPEAEIVKMLVDAGAKLEGKDRDGFTPFMNAVSRGDFKVAEVLKNAGANVNPVDKEGWTLLRIAAYYGKTEIVSELIRLGADVNKKDTGRWTALMMAAQEGKTECLKLLLDAGADTNAKNKYGDTALDIARRENNTECVNILKNYKGGSTVKSSLISIGNVLSCNDALRLRSESNTSSSVVTSMQKGTRVKILEIGRSDTSEGVSSNWARVEILSGGKDKNGASIPEGTSGWCFGGFLE